MNVARVITIAAVATVSCAGVAFAIKKYNDTKKITKADVHSLKAEIEARRAAEEPKSVLCRVVSDEETPAAEEQTTAEVIIDPISRMTDEGLALLPQLAHVGTDILETKDTIVENGIVLEKTGTDFTQVSSARLGNGVDRNPVEMRQPPRTRRRMQVDSFAEMARVMRNNNVDLESGKPQPSSNLENFEHYEEMELFLDFFEKLQQRGKEMEFDRKWLAGDYMDNVVNVKMAGGYYATQDHVSHRKAIIHSTKRGNTIIFQRYKNGQNGILVWNGPEDANLGDNMIDLAHMKRFIDGTYLQVRKS